MENSLVKMENRLEYNNISNIVEEILLKKDLSSENTKLKEEVERLTKEVERLTKEAVKLKKSINTWINRFIDIEIKKKKKICTIS